MADSTPSNTLGATVRQVRERAGFSPRNLEAIVGVPQHLLLRLEHDELGQVTVPCGYPVAVRYKAQDASMRA